MTKGLLTVLIVGFLALPSFAAERAVVVETTLDTPVADVWKAWTTAEEIRSWFSDDVKLDLRTGGSYEIYFGRDAQGPIGCNGCTILAIQPERLLSFTWNAPPHLPEARAQFTHVTVRFEPLGPSRTKVTLREDGWGDGGQWDEAFEYFGKAWPRVFANLEKHFQKSDKPAS